MIIKYKFATKETAEVEVDEQLGNEIKTLSRKRHANNKKTDRYRSPVDIEPQDENAIQIADENSHLVDNLFLREQQRHEHNKLCRAIATLSPKQKDLVRRVFFNGESLTDIAKSFGVTKQSIHERLEWALKKLRKEFLP